MKDPAPAEGILLTTVGWLRAPTRVVRTAYSEARRPDEGEVIWRAPNEPLVLLAYNAGLGEYY